MEKVAIGLGALLLLLVIVADPDRIGRSLEKALRRSLPARSVKVDLDGTPGIPTLQGRFKRLAITIDGLKLRGGELSRLLPIGFTDRPEREGRVREIRLTLRETVYEGLIIGSLVAEAHDARFDLRASLREKRLILASTLEGTLIGYFSPEALRHFLAQRLKKEGVIGLSLRLHNGFFTVKGRWQLGFIPLPFEAKGGLSPKRNDELHIYLLDFRFGKLFPLPLKSLDRLLERLNPLIRFDLTPFRLHLKTVHITPDGITLTATFRLAPMEERATLQ